MTHDISAWPLGKRTDVDLLEGVVSLVRWSWVVAVWLGWTSWEPWRSICGTNRIKKASKTREEAEGVAKKCWGEKWSATRVFIGPKIFAASLRHSDEECLRSSVETFAAVYPKVGKGLRSGVGCYTSVDQKVRLQKNLHLLCSKIETFAARTRIYGHGFFCF